MIALIQRVSSASVAMAAGEPLAAIEQGLVALVGMERGDGEAEADALLERVLHYRLFNDHLGRMNHSLKHIAGGLLLLPQVTLAVDTSRGLRPSFSTAAPAALGEPLFAALCALAHKRYQTVACGRFGANMQVQLTNEGPATFLLRVSPAQQRD